MLGSKRSTLSIPGERPAWAPVSNAPVVGLRVVGSVDTFSIPSDRAFSLGTDADHDVRLSDMTVSKQHCLFEWKGHELWLVDLQSKNGTFVNGVKTTRARVVDGSVIVIGQTTLVAFAAESRTRRSRDELLDGTDPKYRIAVDLAIAGAMAGAVIVVVGEPGTGRETLARAIHEVAVGPTFPFTHLRLGADNATEGAAGMDSASGTLFVQELESLPTTIYRRVVGLMGSGATVETGEQRGRLRVVVSSVRRLWPTTTPEGIVQVFLPPLRDRHDDILVLVDQFAHEHLGTDRRAFPVDVLEALRRYAWPGNLDELREAISRLSAIAKQPTIRAAAESIGMSKSGLTDWLYSRAIPTGKR